MSEPVGIIYPPPELRGIVDSTAKYVAKNGAAFEERIKREHRDKPKFSFLLTGDPFNAYYQYKVKELRNSIQAELQQQEAAAKTHDTVDSDNNNLQDSETHQQTVRPPASTDQSQSDQTDDGRPGEKEARHDESNGDRTERGPDEPGESDDGAPRVRSKLNDYIQEMTMKLEEPPQLSYLATSAPSLTSMECDIIKLTAQFIAKHGRSFLLELVSREQNNSQFDFLKPQHGQFTYFKNLIMQYAIIQNQPLDITEQLSKDATNQKHILDKVKMRAEWTKMLDLERRKQEEAEEKEKILYSQIDWLDFVIVETIDYQPDERGEYPPTTADQVGTRLLLHQRYEERNVPEEMEIDMDVESDEEDGAGTQDSKQANDGFIVPPRPEDIVIRKDYNPKAAPVRASQPDNYFVSPITNERIPVDKIQEHVRYNLSDPRYLEKKEQILQERMKEESMFASGSQTYSSLKNLADHRSDVFGLDGEEVAIGRRIGEEEVEKKDNRLIWDGHKSSLKKKKLG